MPDKIRPIADTDMLVVDDVTGAVKGIAPGGDQAKGATFGGTPGSGSVAVQQNGSQVIASASALNIVGATVKQNSTTPTVADLTLYRAGAAPKKELRQATDACRLPTNISAGAKQLICRSRHKLNVAATYIQAIFPNFNVAIANGGIETGTGGAATISAYLIVGGTNSSGAITGGKAYQVTWGGQTSVTVADKANSPLHDPIFVNVPEGSYIWYQTSVSNAAGIVHESGNATTEPLDSTNGELFRYAPSGLNLAQISSMDAWTGGTSATTFRYAPIVIATPHNKPAVMVVGTSIDVGIRSTANGGGNRGLIPRALAAVGIPYYNVGQASASGQNWLVPANRALRMQLEPYCSHVISTHLINDLPTTLTDAQVLQTLVDVAATFTKPVIGTTCTPYTNGAWTSADGSDQTLRTTNNFETKRQTLNAQVRAGVPGYAGYIDQAAACCIPGTSDSKWFSDGTTNYFFGPATGADGLHPGTQGETYAVATGALDFSMLDL